MSTENFSLSKKMLSFGAGLKKLRKISGLTQTDLGNRVGLSMAAISLIENGKGLPAFDRAFDLAAVFELNPVEVMTIGGDESAIEMVSIDSILPAWLEELLPTLKALTPKEQTMLKAFIEAMKR